MSATFLFRPVAVLLLLGCLGCRTAESRTEAAKHDSGLPGDYIRVDRSQTNRVALQIALRCFVPQKGRGPSIWLAGVSHLGSPEYFEALQQHLDQQPLVLFEGIRAGGRKGSRSPHQVPDTNSAPSSSEDSGIQPNLAAALGLKFQLQAINYDRSNFENSDLTVDELRRLMAEQPKQPDTQGAAEGFESLLQSMQGQSMLNVILRLAIPFMATNPSLQGAAKLALIEILGQIGSDPGKIRGLPPETKQLLEVLLQRRNERVISDLKAEYRSADSSESITVLYGVAHMTDLEERLRLELHYRPKEDRWLTAFEVDYRKSNITPDQAKFVRDLIQRELEETPRGTD